jgi:diguanylate cyclase (GGDEF)-like protein
MPTLWVVFMTNFVAVGLVWLHVMRSYPTFAPARFWTAGALICAASAALGLLRGIIDPVVTLVVGGSCIVLSCCLFTQGIFSFYGKRTTWHLPVIATGIAVVGLAYFLLVDESMAIRIVIYSLAQAIPIAMGLPLVLSHHARRNPGARMAGTVMILMLVIYGIRSVAAIIGVGGELSIVNYNEIQAALVLALVFLAMTWNFGLLLMAIDRLRAEVENLALRDDLTGVANRRHLLQRMTEQCEISMHTGEPFAVLAIDLDGFKEINDGHGHAAGDDCLRRFSRAAQSRLRPGDLLARAGGDEFCVVMPGTTLREGAMIARWILEESRALAEDDGGIPIAASIGVAQWTPQIGRNPERLIAAADVALYSAKKLGKDRYAVYEITTEPLPPAQLEALRKIA